jgi:hypothetical protein
MRRGAGCDPAGESAGRLAARPRWCWRGASKAIPAARCACPTLTAGRPRLRSGPLHPLARPRPRHGGSRRGAGGRWGSPGRGKSLGRAQPCQGVGPTSFAKSCPGGGHPRRLSARADPGAGSPERRSCRQHHRGHGGGRGRCGGGLCLSCRPRGAGQGLWILGGATLGGTRGARPGPRRRDPARSGGAKPLAQAEIMEAYAVQAIAVIDGAGLDPASSIPRRRAGARPSDRRLGGHPCGAAVPRAAAGQGPCRHRGGGGDRDGASGRSLRRATGARPGRIRARLCVTIPAITALRTSPGRKAPARKAASGRLLSSITPSPDAEDIQHADPADDGGRVAARPQGQRRALHQPAGATKAAMGKPTGSRPRARRRRRSRPARPTEAAARRRPAPGTAAPPAPRAARPEPCRTA